MQNSIKLASFIDYIKILYQASNVVVEYKFFSRRSYKKQGGKLKKNICHSAGTYRHCSGE